LAASERRYHALFDGAPVAMFVSRIADGRLIECNGAFRALFGENVGGSDAMVFGDAGVRDAFVEALPDHASRTLQHHGRQLALHGRRLSSDGVECLHVTITDVTHDRQQLDERLTALSQQHRTQLRQFAGGVAHDFNELLARIIAYAEGLREAMTGIEQQRSGRLLHELFATTRRARDLVSQLLLSVETMSRSVPPRATDAGEITIIDAEACIGQLLRESLQHAGFSARVFADSESALEYIAADPGMIALVLLDEPQTDARVARVALRIHALPDAPPVITMRGSGALLLGPGTPDAAVAGTIAKPFSTDALLDVVRTYARRTRHPTYAELPQ